MYFTNVNDGASASDSAHRKHLNTTPKIFFKFGVDPHFPGGKRQVGNMNMIYHLIRLVSHTSYHRLFRGDNAIVTIIFLLSFVRLICVHYKRQNI